MSPPAPTASSPTRSTITGSIGVFGGKFAIADALREFGINPDRSASAANSRRLFDREASRRPSARSCMASLQRHLRPLHRPRRRGPQAAAAEGAGDCARPRVVRRGCAGAGPRQQDGRPDRRHRGSAQSRGLHEAGRRRATHADPRPHAVRPDHGRDGLARRRVASETARCVGALAGVDRAAACGGADRAAAQMGQGPGARCGCRRWWSGSFGQATPVLTIVIPDAPKARAGT